jgi:hypothetical protein
LKIIQINREHQSERKIERNLKESESWREKKPEGRERERETQRSQPTEKEIKTNLC